jgi:transposase
MKAYSLDLRQRVVAAYETGHTSIKAVAERFAVGQSFVKKMLQQKRRSGAVAPPGHGGGRRRSLQSKHLKALHRWLAQEPDLTLRELQEKLRSENNKAISIAALGATLHREGLTLKKSPSLLRKETTTKEVGSGDESNGLLPGG